ncbi:unnamed protein product [Amoebophrya sp. A25]|nr:unnamed protein product [Amoebophrya sp. A25]|eukprot:GSA25T00013236001.1
MKVSKSMITILANYPFSLYISIIWQYHLLLRLHDMIFDLGALSLCFAASRSQGRFVFFWKFGLISIMKNIIYLNLGGSTNHLAYSHISTSISAGP